MPHLDICLKQIFFLIFSTNFWLFIQPSLAPKLLKLSVEYFFPPYPSAVLVCFSLGLFLINPILLVLISFYSRIKYVLSIPALGFPPVFCSFIVS